MKNKNVQKILTAKVDVVVLMDGVYLVDETNVALQVNVQRLQEMQDVIHVLITDGIICVVDIVKNVLKRGVK